MAKYDAVDVLMQQATQPARSEAEAALEARVSASESVATGAALTPPPPAVREPAAGPSATDRGRRILGAMKPFLPVVSGALRMVDHGAVQAVARFLPLLTGVGGSPTANPQQAELSQKLAELLQTMEKQQSALAGKTESATATLSQHEEQIRRLRDSLAKLSSEQNSIETRIEAFRVQARMLVAAVVLALLLSVAEAVALIFFIRR